MKFTSVCVFSPNTILLISLIYRYAMSVIWELDANYEVKDAWYGRTVIRSKYKLFYEVYYFCFLNGFLTL